MKKTQIQKFLLYTFCISHFILGTIAFLGGPNLSEMITLVYGAELEVDPQLTYIARMFGAYMLTVGFLAILPIKDPVKYKGIINGAILLLVLRVLQRLLFAAQIHEAFGVSYSRIILNGIFFFLLAVAMYVSSRKK
ncbi:hypothetical protein ACFLY9_00915 [Patescibacteria group bacterium]